MKHSDCQDNNICIMKDKKYEFKNIIVLKCNLKSFNN